MFWQAIRARTTCQYAKLCTPLTSNISLQPPRCFSQHLLQHKQTPANTAHVSWTATTCSVFLCLPLSVHHHHQITKLSHSINAIGPAPHRGSRKREHHSIMFATITHIPSLHKIRRNAPRYHPTNPLATPNIISVVSSTLNVCHKCCNTLHCCSTPTCHALSLNAVDIVTSAPGIHHCV
jgi:hypothetical protein